MKVLLKRNVPELGKVGDLVDVKPGYARNYLLPQLMAVAPTEENIRAVEADKAQYLQELARQQEQIEARAAVLQGKEITISVRANEEGQLYGSIGPAQIAAALAEQEFFVEPENIVLDEPIRRLDKYDLEVRFTEGVSATIHVWVVPNRDGQAPGEAPPDEGSAEQDAEEPLGAAPEDV